MSRAVALAALAGVAACADPELELRLELPPAYAPLVSAVNLRIFHPPPAAPFGCDALAFGTADPDVVRFSLAGEVSLVQSDEAPLTGVDREVPKVFLAEGYDLEGRRVVVGCAEVGAVRGLDPVVLEGRPVPRVRVASQPSLSRPLGAALEAPVVLAVTDLLDRPLPSTPVRWAVEAGAGRAASGENVSDQAGLAAIAPAIPARPGPFVLEVGARWADGGPLALPGFAAPEPGVLTVPGRIVEYRAGRVGPAAEPGVVGLTMADATGQVRVVALHVGAAGAPVVTESAPIAGSSPRLGLLDHRDARRDRPVVVVRDRWVEVEPGGALRAHPHVPLPPAQGKDPLDVHPAGPCEGSAGGPQLLVTYQGAGVVGIYDAEGQAVDAITRDLGVLASGCVSDQDGRLSRLLVVEGAEVGLQLSTRIGATHLFRDWLAVNVGMGFAPPLAGAPGLLLGVQLSVNDFVVSRVSLVRGVDAFDFETVGLDSPPEIPFATEGGDLDGDGVLDVVALFRRRAAPGDPARYALWVVSGREHRGRRIAGEALVGEAGFRAPTLMLLDLDGDGAEEVLVGERSALERGLAPTRLLRFDLGG
jgi:hypothetical protein